MNESKADDVGSLLAGAIKLQRGDRIHIEGEGTDRWITNADWTKDGWRVHTKGQKAFPDSGVIRWHQVPGSRFVVGQQYKRDEVRLRLGDSEWQSQGGHWAKGHVEFDKQHILFATIGEARTGHDYANVWHAEDRQLEWNAAAGSKRGQAQIEGIIGASGHVLVFVRLDGKDPFTYQGRGVALQIGKSESPVTVLWSMAEEPTADLDELAKRTAQAIARGQAVIARGNQHPRRTQATVFVIERDPEVAASVQIRAKGACEVCLAKAPFLRADGTAYLETHHLVLLAAGGPDTPENAVAACPNCHRELHSGAERAKILTVLYERWTFLSPAAASK